MKIVARGNDLIVKEVYCGFAMETEEGNAIAICMRDDTFEINVLPRDGSFNKWNRVNMKTGLIEEMKADCITAENPHGSAGESPCSR